MEIKNYIVSTQVVYENTYIDTSINETGGVNSIQFINRGSTTANVNGDSIQPNSQVTHGGFPLEINTTAYAINFVGPGTNELTINIKTYV